MIQLTGQLGVPVIVIGGDVMVGFSRERLAQKLGTKVGYPRIRRLCDYIFGALGRN
jgi:hypothetical protein